MSWVRLTLKLQRSSIAFAVFVCLGLAALASWLSLWLPSVREGCASQAFPHDCGVVSVLGSPLGDPAGMTFMVVGVAAYAVPLVLGVAIVPSEVERRTAMVAWPLARSRLRWLLWRAGSVFLVGVALLGVMAVGAEALAGADASAGGIGFAQHGVRGISLLTRAALMFVVALAVGAVTGRLLPAMLVGVALAAGTSTAVGALPPYGVESTELTTVEASAGHPLTTDVGYRAPDGRPIGEDEANAISQAVFAEYSPELPPDSSLPYSVAYGIAGSRYVEVLMRESAVLAGATVVVGGVAVAVVHRRRPE